MFPDGALSDLESHQTPTAYTRSAEAVRSLTEKLRTALPNLIPPYPARRGVVGVLARRPPRPALSRYGYKTRPTW